jgi:hypothetical protein
MNVKKRLVLVVLLTLAAVIAYAAPALASPPTTYVGSQGFTATLDATNAGNYQISLYGSGYSFATSGSASYQSLTSPDSLSVYNSGSLPFNVWVSADASPYDSQHMWGLGFSDSPGQDQVRWTLSPNSWPNSGYDQSVTDSWATPFGSVDPGNSTTLYSFLYTGSGFSHATQYGWTGTVYAVPN